MSAKEEQYVVYEKYCDRAKRVSEPFDTLEEAEDFIRFAEGLLYRPTEFVYYYIQPIDKQL